MMDEAVQEPIEVPIGEIQAKHLSRSITVKGHVLETGKIQAKIKNAVFRCEACKTNIELVQSESKDLLKPEMCPNDACTGNNDFELLIDRSGIIDYRWILVGKIPDNSDKSTNSDTVDKERSIFVELEGNLVTVPVQDAIVSITGTVKTSLQGKPDSMTKIGDYVLYATAIKQDTQNEMTLGPETPDTTETVSNKAKLIAILREMRESEQTHRLSLENVYSVAQMYDISKKEADDLMVELGRRGDVCITGNDLIVLM